MGGKRLGGDNGRGWVTTHVVKNTRVEEEENYRTYIWKGGSTREKEKKTM